MPSVKDIYQFDELTWPEVNEAIEMGKIPIIPVGSVEQHGHHLPLKVDHCCVQAVAMEAAKRRPEISLVMPTVTYGYVHHVMDFPGSINIHFEHFIHYVLDICKSLAYHGFKKMILINGHGSNGPLCDLVSRRVWLETDAASAYCNWWRLLQVDPDFESKWRESEYPGGCAHAGEMETSAMLYLDPDSVRKDKVDSHIAYNDRFSWADLKGSGPIEVTKWTSQGSDSGTFGEADKGTAEKGKLVIEEAGRQLSEFIEHFKAQEIPPRQSKHTTPPTMPLSFPTV